MSEETTRGGVAGSDGGTAERAHTGEWETPGTPDVSVEGGAHPGPDEDLGASRADDFAGDAPDDFAHDPPGDFAGDPPSDAGDRPSDDMLGRFAGEQADDGDHLQRRRRIRTGAIIGAAAVLLCVGVVVGPTAWDLFQERNTRIATPHQVAGLTLDESENAKGTADYLKTAVETGVSFDSAVGAVYTDSGAEPRSVIFVGGTGLFMTPDRELTSLFDLITDQTGGVDEVRTVPAGSLGGVMRCGMTSTEDGNMAVCGWADHGSLAVALFPDRGVNESADLMRQMRGAMQQRD